MDSRDKTSWFIVVLLALAIVANIGQWYRARYARQEVRTDTVTVVEFVEYRDTMPVVMDERVTGKVTILANSCKNGKKSQDSLRTYSNNSSDIIITDTLIKDSGSDSLITLDIVQRKYTDDSTYTAYVSGARIDDDFPRLDSIMILRRDVMRTITQTVYRDRKGFKVKFRPALSAGYDPLNRQWGVMAGGALVLDW